MLAEKTNPAVDDFQHLILAGGLRTSQGRTLGAQHPKLEGWTNTIEKHNPILSISARSEHLEYPCANFVQVGNTDMAR